MKKILHIINNLGSGGAEKLLVELVPLLNEISELKVDILLLTDKNNVFYDELIKRKVNVEIIKYRNSFDPRNIIEIRKYLLNNTYDIIHCHLFPTQYWVAISKLLIRNNKIKFITTEHSTHNRRRDKFYFRLFDKIIYSQFDIIISISDKTKENLLSWLQLKTKDLDKFILIENGVNLEIIKNALPYKKSELVEGVKEEVKFICMVGRFTEAKDQPTLIRAISRLEDDIHLVLVGEGPLIENCINLAKNLGVSHRVHFLGFRKDVPEILKTVDIVVLSSYWEGMSLACIEGLASGKPFLASRVEGIEDIINSDKILFVPDDDLHLSLVIENLFIDKNAYNNQIRECLEISKRFSLHNMINKLIDIYNN